MSRSAVIASLVLLCSISTSYPSAASANDVYPDFVEFSTLTLDELESYDTDGLSKKETKAHKKALKKARKAARREARKNAPRVPYCSRLAKSRGQC